MSEKSGRSGEHRLPLLEPSQAQQGTTTRYTRAVLLGIAEAEALLLAPLIRNGPSGALEAARIASERAERLCDAAMRHEPPLVPIACQKGCSTCCQAKVLVVVPEVLRIAEYLRAHSTEEELARLISRLRELSGTIGGLSRKERAEAHVVCPLLDAEGGCGVHEARPLVCRSWTSYDAKACEAYWQSPSKQLTPVQWAQGYEVTQAVMAGLGKACEMEGREGKPVELIRALLIALGRPNAAKRWFDRLPVFSIARDAEWDAFGDNGE